MKYHIPSMNSSDTWPKRVEGKSVLEPISDEWDRASSLDYKLGQGTKQTPTGPGDFLLNFKVTPRISHILVWYRFFAGGEAEVWPADEPEHVVQFTAPKGRIELPVTAARNWVMRLPADTTVGMRMPAWR